MDNCIFCKIAKGEIPCAKVYEDNDVFAFLDVNPVAPGHCLVIPKQHFENVFDIDETVLQKIIVAAKNISEKIKTSLNVEAVNLVNSSGKEAGQEVMHFHLHIIPRQEHDGLQIHGIRPENTAKTTLEDLKIIAAKINA